MAIEMPKVARAVALSNADRDQLQNWIKATSTPQQMSLRARIVLMAADGKQDLEIAAELEVNRHTAALWRKRFLSEGLDGVREIQPGRGRKTIHGDDKVAVLTRQTKG